MKNSIVRTLMLLVILPIFLATGCAWQSDLDALRQDVSALDSKVDKADAQALETATAAAKTSEQAAKEAIRAAELSQQAVEAAQAANTRVARILDKPATIVYALEFGSNKSRVSLAMGRKIDEILNDWDGKAAAFQIVGHTDKTGESEYNISLSQKRADEVKAALVKRGIPAQIVSAIGVGEKDPGVQTSDGKRLRANRIVVLTVLPKIG